MDMEMDLEMEICPMDKAPALAPWTYENLDWTKFKFDGSVSTETHTVAYVARHLAAYMKRKRALAAAAEERATRKQKVVEEEALSVKTAPAKINLRALAFEAFDRQKTVAQFRKDHDITYGNAHYYFRQWKKSKGVN